MVETLTPAGCGGPARRRIALIFFGLGSIAAAAAVGALAGAFGALLPGRPWLIALAITLAVAGALREAGLVPVGIPDLRRQVPEVWRRSLPLPVWSAGYGAILGSGFGTYQPAATYWVTVAAAIAVGDPVVGATGLAVFGLARTVMVAAPGGDPIASLARRHRYLRPVNVAALAILALMLVPAVATSVTAPPPPPSGQSDPASSNGVFAYTEQAGGTTSVVVQAPGAPPIVFAEGRMPTLDGDTLAYVDAQGIRVVFWRTGAEVTRLPGRVDTPAISGPRLAYTRRIGARTLLEVRNISTGRVRRLANVGPGIDLGRPSASGQLVAWHESAGSGHRLLLHSLATGRTRTITERRRRYQAANPAIVAGHILWVESDAETSWLVLRRIEGGPIRVLASALGPRHIFTNVALERGVASVTRWTIPTTTARILRVRWAPLPRRAG